MSQQTFQAYSWVHLRTHIYKKTHKQARMHNHQLLNLLKLTLLSKKICQPNHKPTFFTLSLTHRLTSLHAHANTYTHTLSLISVQPPPHPTPPPHLTSHTLGLHTTNSHISLFREILTCHAADTHTSSSSSWAFQRGSVWTRLYTLTRLRLNDKPVYLIKMSCSV